MPSLLTPPHATSPICSRCSLGKFSAANIKNESTVTSDRGCQRHSDGGGGGYSGGMASASTITIRLLLPLGRTKC